MSNLFSRKSSRSNLKADGDNANQTPGGGQSLGIPRSPQQPPVVETPLPPKVPQTPAAMQVVVGVGVKMRADISSTESLVVAGELEGLSEAKHIVIETGGVVKGAILCETLQVAGTFEGVNVTVTKRLVVKSTGKILSEVIYKNLSVESGGIVTGSLRHDSSITFTPGALISTEEPTSRVVAPPPPVENVDVPTRENSNANAFVTPLVSPTTILHGANLEE